MSKDTIIYKKAGDVEKGDILLRADVLVEHRDTKVIAVEKVDPYVFFSYYPYEENLKSVQIVYKFGLPLNHMVKVLKVDNILIYEADRLYQKLYQMAVKAPSDRVERIYHIMDNAARRGLIRRLMVYESWAYCLNDMLYDNIHVDLNLPLYVKKDAFLDHVRQFFKPGDSTPDWY